MSGSAPHPNCTYDWARPWEALAEDAEHPALPESVALRTWWIWLVDNRPFVEGLASVSIAGEGQVPELEMNLPVFWNGIRANARADSFLVGA